VGSVGMSTAAEKGYFPFCVYKSRRSYVRQAGKLRTYIHSRQKQGGCRGEKRLHGLSPKVKSLGQRKDGWGGNSGRLKGAKGKESHPSQQKKCGRIANSGTKSRWGTILSRGKKSASCRKKKKKTLADGLGLRRCALVHVVLNFPQHSTAMRWEGLHHKEKNYF